MKHHLKIVIFFSLIFLTFGRESVSGQAANVRIEWETVNPFRFITDSNSTDELRDVYNKLSIKSSFELERALQDLDEAETDQRRAEANKLYNCKTTKSKRELSECYAPYYGWFARLALNNYEKTCWDASPSVRDYRHTGPCQDYIHPLSHRVRAWIVGSGSSTPSQWTLDNKPLQHQTSCSTKYQKTNCVEFDVPYDEEKDLSHNLSTVLADGGNLNVCVVVHDKLIVGLGDSYASGEGNPDIPARFIYSRPDHDLFTWHPQIEPRRDKHSQPSWLEKGCHRSMYSYQFKTALLIALSNPQDAVTFLSYSCSGAVTENIFKDKQKADEGGKQIQPQLSRLQELLTGANAKQRHINYLLLSTGGNDIGFVGFVAYIVAPSLFKSVAGHPPHESTVNDIRKTLLGDASRTGNYRALQNALLDPKNGVQIDGCEVSKPCPQIVLTTYPNILYDLPDQPCEVSNIFDQDFRPDATRTARLKLVDQLVVQPLKVVQTEEIKKLNLGWTVVMAHSDQFVGHAFCSGIKSPISIDDNFVIPTKHKSVWQPFDPRDYRAFGRQQRWVRIPVDAKLTTDQSHKFWFISTDILFEDVRSSIMHPTAAGLSKTSDANFTAIEKLEKLTPEICDKP